MSAEAAAGARTGGDGSARYQPEETARVSVRVPMRWADMDAYGHINNVNVARMMEEARIAAFGVPGGTGFPGVEPDVDLFANVPAGTQVLVVEHRIRYARPLEYRNVPAEVELWISGISAASFDISYEFRDPVEGHVCVRALTTLAFFDAEAGRLMRLPAGHRDALQAYVGEPALG